VVEDVGAECGDTAETPNEKSVRKEKETGMRRQNSPAVDILPSRARHPCIEHGSDKYLPCNVLEAERQRGEVRDGV
jgi:hypothetical protein